MSWLLGCFLLLVLGAAALHDPRPARKKHELPPTLDNDRRRDAWIRRRAQKRIESARIQAEATELAHARKHAAASEFNADCTVITQ